MILASMVISVLLVFGVIRILNPKYFSSGSILNYFLAVICFLIPIFIFVYVVISIKNGKILRIFDEQRADITLPRHVTKIDGSSSFWWYIIGYTIVGIVSFYLCILGVVNF